MSGTIRFVRAGWVAAISGAVIVACQGERAREAEPAPGRDTAAVATPAVSASTAGAAVPGWLAFGVVRPGGEPARPWTPAHPSAEVVAFTATWPGAPGTRVFAVAAGFADTVRFAGVTKEPYGCDGVPTSMAGFEAARIPPEGPVWLAPVGSPVEAVPLEETTPPAAGARAWRAGEVTIVLSPLGPSGARLALEVESVPVWSRSFETYAMGEGELPPVDLEGVVPGIPVPVGAFRARGAHLPLVVLWRPGYEGNAFDLLRADQDPPVLVEGEPIYFCAY